MAKKPSPAKRVEVAHPRHRDHAHPLETDLDAWLAAGWKQVETPATKEMTDGD